MIPTRTKDAIDRYVEAHRPVGGFLAAVLSNDLAYSFWRADQENRANLFDIVVYCWNEIPAPCWGSPQKVKAWLQAPHKRVQDMPNDPEQYYNERAERMP